jgi:hypothetical protein
MKESSRLAAVAVAFFLASTGLARAETSFPQEIDSAAGKIVVYQPQPEKLAGNTLTGRAAFSLLLKGKTEPVFGALWFTSRLETDQEADLATLNEIRVTKVRWPESAPGDEAALTKAVEGVAAAATVSLTGERLSASLANAEREQKSLDGLKNDPPRQVAERRSAGGASEGAVRKPLGHSAQDASQGARAAQTLESSTHHNEEKRCLRVASSSS